MILSACLCLVLLNLGLTSAFVYDSEDKANEINYYVVVNFLERYKNDFPALEKKLEVATHQCELKINATVDTCLACIERNQNSGNSPGNVGFDKVILGLIPAPVSIGLDKFGNGIKDTFAKKIPNFVTGTIPKTAGNVGKEIGKFVTGTVPNAFGSAGKDIGKFFTGTLPGVTKTVGKELGTFFTGTIPNVGKKIGNGFKNFGNAVKDLFGGRRRRAASVCPSCDKINNEKLSTDQIRLNVCGQELFDIFQEYVDATNVFQWLKDENNIVTKVSFETNDADSRPLEKVLTVKPFTVTYSIGAGAAPQQYTETKEILDVNNYSNTPFGNALANKIWKKYVPGSTA